MRPSLTLRCMNQLWWSAEKMPSPRMGKKLQRKNRSCQYKVTDETIVIVWLIPI